MMSSDHTPLLKTLRTRFEKHPARHARLSWDQVQARIDARPEVLDVLAAMEATGGEPDVIDLDGGTGAIVFCDCSAESPSGRRSGCYDREARESRKENRPERSALEQAQSMGIELLTEAQYRALQALGEFDLKTSSWLLTPPEMRALGGALFGDRRYDRVFTYHNGVQSYYAARGFRGWVQV